jgi:hypothetical protein
MADTATAKQPITREEALALIDDIRDGLPQPEPQPLDGGDHCNRVLVSIIRDLADGYPLADVFAAAARLRLTDYAAEMKIKHIVSQLRPADHAGAEEVFGLIDRSTS